MESKLQPWDKDSLREFVLDYIEDFAQDCDDEDLAVLGSMCLGKSLKFENGEILGPAEDDEEAPDRKPLPFGMTSPEAIAKYFEIVKQYPTSPLGCYKVPRDLPERVFGHADSYKTAMQVLKAHLVKQGYIEVVKRGSPVDLMEIRILKEPA